MKASLHAMKIQQPAETKSSQNREHRGEKPAAMLVLAQGLGHKSGQWIPHGCIATFPNWRRRRSISAPPTCHYRAIFGEGDKENRTLQTVARFGEVTVDRAWQLPDRAYDRQEEIYFVVEGGGMLHY